MEQGSRPLNYPSPNVRFGIGREKPRKHKTPRNAKYDYKLAGVASRLLSAGHTRHDVAYILGIAGRTMDTWERKHPEFKQGCRDGHDIANAVTLAQFLRCAWGIHWTEERRIYNVRYEKDENGNDKPVEYLARRTEIDKYLPPNPDLLKFEMLNKMSDEYRDTRRVEVAAKKFFSNVGEPEAGQIECFFGLTKAIIGSFETEGKKVESVQLEQPRTGSSDDTERPSPEHPVS